MVSFQNASQRKQTERELHSRLELLEHVFSNDYMLIAYLDADFNFIRVNKAYAAADDKNPEYFVGKNHFDLYPNAENEAIFRRVAETGKSYCSYAKAFVYSHNPERGVTYWDWTLQPVKDTQGRVEALVFLLQDVSKRVRADFERRQSEALFRAIAEQSGEGIAIVDSHGHYRLVNPQFAASVGYSQEELQQGGNIKDLLPPGVRPEVFPMAVNNHSVVRERELIHKDGSLIPVELTGYPLVFGEERLALVIMRDVSQRRKAAAEMEKLSSALKQTADSVIITDRNGIIEYVNPAFSESTGFSAEEALGRRPNIVKSDKHDVDFYQRLWETIQSGQVYRDVLINRKKDGTLFYEEKTITPLKDTQGVITHFISTGKDITERMYTQERLYYLAHHDVVTGLPNRFLFMERLQHALPRAHRTKTLVAVLFLDLDRFKKINDTLGHDAGDQLLQTTGERLRGCVREDDTVARLGGDEFTILLENIVETDDIILVTEKLLKTMGHPFFINGHELFVTPSIGISVYPDDSKDPQELLTNADAAMYLAKDSGRNRYRFYSADMNTMAFERLTLETGLRHAMERNELLLHYQPLVDLMSGRIIGVEALLRWQHPELGLVSPVDFVPLLEDTGLIVPVGEWVMMTACKQAQQWQESGLGPVRMSINLSAGQFYEPHLIDTVRRCLQESGLAPTLLELEITESVIMRNAESTIETLTTLSAMGVRLAVDDFGTGYSSLSYLKRFPIHTLKIDKSFINDVATSADDAAIIRAIVAMAHNLKLDVVAEGVETDVQRLFLNTCACDSVQGFLYSTPLTEKGARGLLEKGVMKA